MVADVEDDDISVTVRRSQLEVDLTPTAGMWGAGKQWGMSY